MAIEYELVEFFLDNLWSMYKYKQMICPDILYKSAFFNQIIYIFIFSGISSLSLTGSKKDSVLQKKSIFTIAYDNMAKKDIDFKSADENSQVED